MGKYDKYTASPERRGGKYDKYLPPPRREKEFGRLQSMATGFEAGEGWGFADEAAGGRAAAMRNLPKPAASALSAFLANRLIPGMRAGSGIGHALTGLIIEGSAPEGGEVRETYESARDARRDLEERAHADNPWSYGAGEFAGILTSAPPVGAPARAPAAAAVKAAGTSSKLKAFLAGLGRAAGDVLKTTAGGATAGGAFGAASGAASASGGVEERLHGAAAGALTGAEWGAGLAPAARYVAAPFVALVARRLLTSPEQKALDMVLKRMNRSGVSVDDARAQFEQWARTGEVPETLAEHMGPNEKGLLSALITSSTETRSKAAEVLLGRGRDEVERLEGKFAEAMGSQRGDFPKLKAEAARARVEDPEPLYTAAHTYEIAGQRFRKFLDRKVQKPLEEIVRNSEAARKALFDAANYADIRRRPMVRDELRRFAQAIENRDVQVPKLSVEAADYWERIINRRYDQSLKGQLNDVPSGWKDLRDAVRGVIDGPTGLGEARATAAERIQRARLLDEGRRFMHKNVDIEDVENVLRGDLSLDIPPASPEGRTAYVAGAARAISDELRNVPDMKGFADATRRVARTPAIREKIEAVRPKVLTKSGAEHRGRRQTRLNRELDEAIERTADRADFTNEMLGNSKTAFRQTARDEAVAEDTLAGHLGNLVEDLLIAGPEGARQGLRARLGGWAGNLVSQPGVLNPAINRAAADLLLATGEEIPGALAALGRRANEHATRRLLPLWPQYSAERLAGYFGGRDGALADPYAQDFETAYSADAARADAVMIDTLKTASPEDRARIVQEYERLMRYMPPEEARLVREELERAAGATVH